MNGFWIGLGVFWGLLLVGVGIEHGLKAVAKAMTERES